MFEYRRKDLKYLIMDDLTPLGVDIKELRNIVIFTMIVGEKM